jgi:hypothetical protein
MFSCAFLLVLYLVLLCISDGWIILWIFGLYMFVNFVEVDSKNHVGLS